ncbi:MAG: hypothetical protein M1817_000150 [Caeruleum heppii]|nr:MAG: hypothetical protein M1817_000150 [Caeruleum heppii]
MALAEQLALSFTIPSVHDDTVLDCRVYHPINLTRDCHEGRGPWQKRGAIIAHPYAPLGGSFDDPVVAAVAQELLQLDFIVGTFNFRGGGESKGHTSWTAKAELGDYLSVIGFLTHYLHHLQPTAPSTSAQHDALGLGPPLSTIPSLGPDTASGGARDASPTILILGGYSYGAMITIHLPSTAAILNRFRAPSVGSAEAEISLRAAGLARQWNAEQRQNEEMRRGRSLRLPHNRSTSHSIVVGGEETNAETRRASRESKRPSMEVVRRSVDLVRKGRSLSRRQQSGSGQSLAPDEGPEMVEISVPRTCYLLVSPLLPPVSRLATLFTAPTAADSVRGPSHVDGAGSHLTSHLTLAVYGTKDGFTSIKKLRRWAQELSSGPHSRFASREVDGAGHFWQEVGTEVVLRREVKQWAQGLLEA